MEPTKRQIETWVRALRSGEYEQARHVLQKGEKFCCLGVACDIFIPNIKKLTYRGRLVGSVPSTQLHSPEWLTLIDNNFYLNTGVYLHNLNDGIGNGRTHVNVDENELRDLRYTFDEIADLLELVYIHRAMDEVA
jgi:hypothetical protein